MVAADCSSAKPEKIQSDHQTWKMRTVVGKLTSDNRSSASVKIDSEVLLQSPVLQNRCSLQKEKDSLSGWVLKY